MFKEIKNDVRKFYDAFLEEPENFKEFYEVLEFAKDELEQVGADSLADLFKSVHDFSGYSVINSSEFVEFKQLILTNCSELEIIFFVIADIQARIHADLLHKKLSKEIVDTYLSIINNKYQISVLADFSDYNSRCIRKFFKDNFD